MAAPLSDSPQDVYERSVAEGRALLDKKDFAKAADCFEKAVQIRGNQAELCFVLAALREKLSDPDNADRFYRKAIALKPESFEYLYAHAMFQSNTGRFAEAIETLNRCAKIRPGNAQLLNDLGVVHHSTKDYSRAVDFLTRSSEMNPGYLVPLINLGYVYIEKGDLDKARALVEKLKARDPGNCEIRELSRKLAQAPRAAAEEKTELLFSDHSYAIAPLRMIEKFGQSTSGGAVGLSIVVPVFNEEENLPVLFKELSAALSGLRQEYEIIFIDDGSSDKSRAVLADIAATDRRVRAIFFRRNYGQTAAIGAGFKYARGEVVITLDADLQNDPADIPRLLEKMAEGYDLVNGWRKDRQDKLLSRKIPSMVANRIINKLIEGTGVQLRDFGCTLKAYKKGIVKNIHLYGEMHRFIPVFAAWLGVKVTEIPVNHRPRLHGKAKYNLSRVSRVIFDLIVVRFFSDYMTRPIQFFGKFARNIASWGLIVIAALSGLGLSGLLPVSLNTILVLTALLLFSCLQLLTMGLLGELMIRFYFEGQQKDYYVVERIINDPEQR